MIVRIKIIIFKKMSNSSKSIAITKYTQMAHLTNLFSLRLILLTTTSDLRILKMGL